MKQETRARLRRGLVEGAVIVLSILLAFAIDAWWAERRLAQEEAAMLASLEAEFTSNLDQLDRVVDTYTRSRTQVARLRRMSEDEVRALEQAEVSNAMLALCNPWTFDPVLGTTDVLIGAGRLGILQDARLREAITVFTNLVADLREDVDYLQTNAKDIWRAEIELGGPWTDPATEVGYHGAIQGLDFIPKATPDDLIRVRESQACMGHVALFHLNAAYYVAELQGLRRQIEHILELLARST